MREAPLSSTPGRAARSRGRPPNRHDTTADGGLAEQRRRATEPRRWTREAGSERNDGYWAGEETDASRRECLCCRFHLLPPFYNNLHEQLMSRDWLRHSTVDRRTLRPLSMVHFDPCQQPCCPTPTLPSARPTCNTERRRNASTTTTASSRARGEAETDGKTRRLSLQ